METFAHIDIHSHLADHYFDDTRDEVLARMGAANVGTITVGTSLVTSQRAVTFANANSGVFACIGVHPEGDEVFDELSFAKLLSLGKVVSVGECGFDFFRAERDVVRGAQTALFEAQVSFAAAHNLPLMLHLRSTKGTFDAYDDMLALLTSLSREYGEALRGNVHFFAADITRAHKFFDLGFTISVTGVVTFAREYDRVVREVPLSMLQVETDAPFVAPIPYRGSPSEPIHILAIIDYIARCRGLSVPEVASAVRETTRRIFGL